MSRVIGIDLGTTNSLCAVFLAESPRLIPNASGEFLTPSVVGILEDGQVLVGAAARELQVTRPELCAACFKRWMGSNQSAQLGDRKFSATELSSLVLRSLKHDAEEFLQEEVTEAVITVPAYFNDSQRRATRLAGEMAQLKVRRIVNEPTAAALTYGFHDRQAEKRLVVIDLGGGTFDVTLMEIFEGTLEIISTAGESFLGGEDFTDRLVATVLKQSGMQLETAELQEPLRVSRLRQQCELAKRSLSKDEGVTVSLPDREGKLAEDSPKYKITAASFEKITEDLLQRLKGPIGKALRDADTSPELIDEVIFVGGATRMPLIESFARTIFDSEPLRSINPDEVVALGAAVQAALLTDDQAVDDMVMTDVCPYTLGIEMAKELGNRLQGGYFAPIIHRNTTIPVSREENFYTVRANQREVNIAIYQGENRRVEKNLKLGELTVSGIPIGPSGQEFFVRFTYDLNGILEVEAFIPDTGKKFQTVITQHAESLSPKEIEQAVDRLQQLKFYPRDELENQQLLRFSERVVGEISPYERDGLEEAIDFFERAMASGDKATFESARETILIVLSQLGFEFTEQSDEPER